MSRTRKIFLFVALPLVIIFGITAYFTLGSNDTRTDDTSENKLTKNACPILITPVDVSLVTSMLYPGQVRGGERECPYGVAKLPD